MENFKSTYQCPENKNLKPSSQPCFYIWRTSHFFWSNTALSKYCYSHIRELRCIRPYLAF